MGHKFISYSRHSIGFDDILSVVKTLTTDWLTQGPKVQEFEQALCDYTGARFAVVFSNGTAALHAAYAVAGVGSTNEVLVPANTFLATANAALYLQSTVRFCDIDARTGNMDVGLVEGLLTDKTKYIVPVHYAGNPVNMKQVSTIAQKHGLTVIEDAAHALGATYRGTPIGDCRYSRMTTLSFHPLKAITTAEGGAVLTNNQQDYERLVMFRQHGVTKKEGTFQLKKESDGPWYYEMQMLGFNYRLSDMQCALGVSQLSKVDRFIHRRQQIAESYHCAFIGLEYFDMLALAKEDRCAWHLFPILLQDRYILYKKEIFEKFREANIGVQSHYIPVYAQPYYRDLTFQPGTCPQAERFSCREISLPIHPRMSQGDVARVIDTVIKIFKVLKV